MSLVAREGINDDVLHDDDGDDGERISRSHLHAKHTRTRRCCCRLSCDDLRKFFSSVFFFVR